MQQVVIALRKRESERVIAALQDAGVLHLKPITEGPLPTGALVGEDGHVRREDERLLARLESTLAELGVNPGPVGALPAENEWEAVIEGAAQPAAQLSKQRQELQADTEAQAAYRTEAAALSEMAGPLAFSRRIALIPFVTTATDSLAGLEAALKETLPERYALESRVVGGNRVGVVATLRNERDLGRAALSKVHLGELRLPGRFDGMPFSQAAAELEQIHQTAGQRQQQLSAERDRLAAERGPALLAIRHALKDRVAIHDVRAVSARGKYSMAMQGYIPADRALDLQKALAPFGDGVSYEVHAVDEHHDDAVPIELKNGGFVKPFQLLMGLIGYPKYGTFDPTWVIALFFPFFFGMIIADMGYGLLFFAFGMWLMNKAKRGEGWSIDFFGAYIPPALVRDLGFVTNVMAFWSVLWGFLTGEFFGTFLERLGVFYIDPVLTKNLWGLTVHPAHHETPFHMFPILFPRLETEVFANTALFIALLFGVLQVIWGWGVRASQGIKHKDPIHMWEGIAMMGGLSALVALAFASEAGKNLGVVSQMSNPLVLWFYIGMIIFAIGYAMVAKKVPLLGLELLSQGGSMISYARIFAVGIVSAILAKLATDVGFSMAHSMGPIGAVLGFIVGLLIHLLILAFTLIGHILQPVRLHMVEFLNPTGYHEGSSPVYSPLRRLSPGGQVK